MTTTPQQKNDVPELFKQAVDCLNNVPLHTNVFICHTWVSKPTNENNETPRPAAWLISSETMQGAIECSHSIRSILDYIYIESTAKRISTDEISSIIACVCERVKLLLPEEAALIFSDINHSIILSDNKIDDLVIAPFTIESGFRIFNVKEYTKIVPSINNV